MLPDGQSVTFSAAGELLHGEPEVVEEELTYLIEKPSGALDLLKPSEFLKRVAAVPALAVAPFTAAQAKEHQQRWAKHLGVPVVESNSIGMKMALIPPGEFLMGSTEEEIAESLRQAEEEKGTLTKGLAKISQAKAHNIKSESPIRLVSPCMK